MIDGPDEVEVGALYPEETIKTLDECFDDFFAKIGKPVDSDGINAPNGMVEPMAITAKRA